MIFFWSFYSIDWVGFDILGLVTESGGVSQKKIEIKLKLKELKTLLARDVQ